MTEDHEPIELDPKDIDAEAARLYGELMDMNAAIVATIRSQMRNIEVLRDAFLLQADRCTDVIHLLAASGAVAAVTSGDLLLNEFRLERFGQDDPDDDDLGDEDD